MAVGHALPGGAQDPAKGDHPRSRCDRRPAAWASGGAVLSWLLRLLLLSAAVHFLRPASAGGETEAGEHRWLGWGGGGDCPHRGADPRALAAGAHYCAG